MRILQLLFKSYDGLMLNKNLLNFDLKFNFKQDRLIISKLVIF